MKLCWTDNYIPSSSRPKWRWLSRPGRRLKILCWSLFKSRNSTFANVGCLSFKNFCVILQLEAEHFCRFLKNQIMEKCWYFWRQPELGPRWLPWGLPSPHRLATPYTTLPISLTLKIFHLTSNPRPHQSGTPCSALWNIFHLYRQKFNKYKVF